MVFIYSFWNNFESQFLSIDIAITRSISFSAATSISNRPTSKCPKQFLQWVNGKYFWSQHTNSLIFVKFLCLGKCSISTSEATIWNNSKHFMPPLRHESSPLDAQNWDLRPIKALQCHQNSTDLQVRDLVKKQQHFYCQLPQIQSSLITNQTNSNTFF